MFRPMFTFLFSIFAAFPAVAAADVGVFSEGPFVVLSDDGFKMKLTKDFSYTDLKAELWTTPAGSVVNGASIPKVFWSYIGGPLSGKFRNASIIHDRYCDIKDRPHEDVHANFYEAMLQSGVSKSKAWIMYQAVARFGPKWDMKALSKCREENPSNLALCVQNSGIELTINDPSEIELNQFFSDVSEMGYRGELEQLKSSLKP